MLQSLTINNYALLVDVEVEFGPGLNILTGETGAGKSIILGALGIILGERVDTSTLRRGATKAVVEGQFSTEKNPALRSLLGELDVGDGTLILRREILESGRTRAFVNDTPVPLTTLQEIGNLLVDLHGQHEHQSLLKVQNHLTYLDQFGNLEQEAQHVAKTFAELQAARSKLQALQEKQRTLTEKKDLYAFQIDEINKVDPLPGEDEELLKEEKLVQHGERLFNLTAEMYQILYEDENSVLSQLGRVRAGLGELQNIDERFGSHQDECESAKLLVEELAKQLREYNGRIEFSPERLEQIQTRLAALAGLKKKFGRSLEEILALRDEMQATLSQFEDLDEEIRTLEREVATRRETFSQACVLLSGRRAEVARQLEQSVPEILDYLGMPRSRFRVDLQYHDDPDGMVDHEGRTYRGGASGMDIAQFLISTNPGEEIKPLAKVASGGEISRIMLALKSLLAQRGQIPVLIFDEIDIGVSGRLAQAVGRKLRELSRFHQVICITHLPQIASMGNHHYLVQKEERDGRTASTIRKLSEAERAEAIAQLLSGEKVSEAHLKSAWELLQDAALN